MGGTRGALLQLTSPFALCECSRSPSSPGEVSIRDPQSSGSVSGSHTDTTASSLIRPLPSYPLSRLCYNSLANRV